MKENLIQIASNIKTGEETFSREHFTSVGTKNQIRVYPIDVVKGMEFDVVFFHNIDKNSNASDMIKRYIYVGVSRAAFFLEITLEEESPDITKYFAAGETWEKLV